MIELILILSFLFLIYVFFYKQTTNEYTITQLEFNTISTKLQELLYDKIPIVIRNVAVPNCVLPNVLLNTQRFQKVLGDYLNEKDTNLPQSNEFQQFMANETGFQVISEHSWMPYLQVGVASKYISSLKTKLCFGTTVLTHTNAIYTVIVPIKGNYICSLVNNEFTKQLPKTNVSDIEQIHSNIQYIDVVLKPNTVLILPPHWHYIMKEQIPYSYYGCIEYHEPISVLMNYLEKTK
jgi:hypothetical protein